MGWGRPVDSALLKTSWFHWYTQGISTLNCTSGLSIIVEFMHKCGWCRQCSWKYCDHLSISPEFQEITGSCCLNQVFPSVMSCLVDIMKESWKKSWKNCPLGARYERYGNFTMGDPSITQIASICSLDARWVIEISLGTISLFPWLMVRIQIFSHHW